MVFTGLIWLIGTTIVFVVILVVVQAEQKRGTRFLLSGVRGGFDSLISKIDLKVAAWWDHFVRYIVQLGWYYGLHSFLQAVLKTIVAFYERVESVFEINRHRTKQLRDEKKQATTQNHLTEMAQHKADTALTPAQQRRRKASHLKGD